MGPAALLHAFPRRSDQWMQSTGQHSTADWICSSVSSLRHKESTRPQHAAVLPRPELQVRVAGTARGQERDSPLRVDARPAGTRARTSRRTSRESTWGRRPCPQALTTSTEGSAPAPHRPCSGSIRKVAQAWKMQLLHPMHVNSSARRRVDGGRTCAVERAPPCGGVRTSHASFKRAPTKTARFSLGSVFLAMDGLSVGTHLLSGWPVYSFWASCSRGKTTGQRAASRRAPRLASSAARRGGLLAWRVAHLERLLQAHVEGQARGRVAQHLVRLCGVRRVHAHQGTDVVSRGARGALRLCGTRCTTAQAHGTIEHDAYLRAVVAEEVGVALLGQRPEGLLDVLGRGVVVHLLRWRSARERDADAQPGAQQTCAPPHTATGQSP